MHGKSVLEGELKEIKERYMKKNIFIKGNIKKEDLLNIEGVYEVKENANEFEVKINNADVVSNVFKKIKDAEITKFVVEEPSLNEIFVAKVGESFEK